METKAEELKLLEGLSVIYDGKKYKLLLNGQVNEYRIGAMICEYFRLAPDSIKEVILSCEGLYEKETAETFSRTFAEFHDKLFYKYPRVAAAMIETEFTNALSDWFSATRSNQVDEYKQSLGLTVHKDIKDYIFKDTGISDYGNDSVLQLLLTCYSGFSSNYVLAKGIFNRIYELEKGNEEQNKAGLDMIITLFKDFLHIQHIDFRIMVTNNGLESLYTIKSSMSLLMFEIAHCIETDTSVSKCKNCGNYFIPERRSDEIYCSYPVWEGKTKTCKDVGAQVTRAKKEKSDVATREYRKVYMRYMMMVKRHPKDKEIENKLLKLKTEVKIWRAKLNDGSAELNDYLKWLNQF